MVVYYTPEVFKSAGICSRKGLVGVTVIMGIAKASFVLVSSILLDHYDRRPLLLLGTSGMAFSSAEMGFGSMFLHHSQKKPIWANALFVLCVLMFPSFQLGLGRLHGSTLLRFSTEIKGRMF